jgi:hypothetical protein
MAWLEVVRGREAADAGIRRGRAQRGGRLLGYIGTMAGKTEAAGTKAKLNVEHPTSNVEH